jgi:hypothetical protein
MKQLSDYFCGPATAAMILKALGVNAPAGVVSDTDWQNRLWDDIKNITTGPKRSPDAAGSKGYIADFEKQQCFLCTTWFCWAATPQALNDLLNQYMPPQKHVHLSRSADVLGKEITATLLQSVDAGMPAALGRGDETHWVVVHGYKVGQGRKIGNQEIYGIYVRDPQVQIDTTGTGLDLVPIDEFISTLAFVECGSSDDQNKMVAVVGQ